MTQKIRFHNSESYTEITDVWHKRWFASNIADWRKGKTAEEVLKRCDSTATTRPIILACYYTCVPYDSFADGVYSRGWIPLIDDEDDQIVKNLTYVAIDKNQFSGGIAENTKIHDIEDFLPPYNEGCRHCYCECWQEQDNNKENV